jgi:hypothetical protein
MPVFVALLVALFGAALVSVVVYLAGFAAYAWWTQLMLHLPEGYFRQIVAVVLANALFGALVAGTPLFFVLHLLRWVRWWSSILAGFVVAAVPGALVFWPLRHASGTVVSISVMRGGQLVQTVSHGALTGAGWLDYGQNILTAALPGALGGLVFWLIWRRMEPVLQKLPARTR